jgi:anti-sigma B factor antagonist
MMPPTNSAFSATVSHLDGDSATVTVTGELDISTAPALKSVLDELCENGSLKVIVELSEMSFIDSSGLAVLAAAQNQLLARGSQLSLRSPNRNALRVLEIGGLTAYLNVEVHGTDD